MSPQEIEALAALIGTPGFEVLKRELKEVEQGLMESLKAEGDAKAALIKLRIWQAFSRLADIITTRPEEAQVAVESLVQEAVNPAGDPYADHAFGF